MTKNAHKKLELVDIRADMPCQIHTIITDAKEGTLGRMGDVIEHWHPELEIVCTLDGNALHYIDGKTYKAHPGSIFVINSESIHKVIKDNECTGHNKKIAVIVQIKKDFVEHLIPNMENKYFLTSVSFDNKKIYTIMEELSAYSDRNYSYTISQKLHLVSLIHELLSQIVDERLVNRFEALPKTSEDKINRLRNIMEYIGDNYSEKLTEEEVSAKFYFTKEYFCRFFKKNTGLTFKEYLTRFRLNKAEAELINTNDSIMDIALNNGFSDSKGFINSFKSYFNQTPLQYRKKHSQK